MTGQLQNKATRVLFLRVCWYPVLLPGREYCVLPKDTTRCGRTALESANRENDPGNIMNTAIRISEQKKNLAQTFYFGLSHSMRQFICTIGNFKGGWVSYSRNTNQFLQIDLENVTKVSRIVTQGSFDQNWWTKTYTLDYSQDGVTFISYNSSQVLV